VTDKAPTKAVTELSPRQMLAVGYFARGASGKEVASALGVSQATICAYRRNSQFNEAIHEEQQALFEQVGGKTLSTVLEAIRTLKDIMGDPAARDSDRIAAARAIITSTSTFSENRKVEAQLNSIETLFKTYLGEAEAIAPEDEDPQLLDAEVYALPPGDEP
jgi:transcriptional regulator with XRE-family HTH domain